MALRTQQKNDEVTLQDLHIKALEWKRGVFAQAIFTNRDPLLVLCPKMTIFLLLETCCIDLIGRIERHRVDLASRLHKSSVLTTHLYLSH